MLDWPAYGAAKTVLARVEAHLAVDPESADGHCVRASLLHNLGQDAQSLAAFERALELAPQHLQALAGAGMALRRMGKIVTARGYFERAVAAHPNDAGSRIHLANLLAGTDPDAAQAEYAAALALDPGLRAAHRGLCRLAAERGDARAAAEHRALGFAGDATAPMLYRGEAWPVPALLLLSTDGGNLDASDLLDDRVYQTTALYVEAFDASAALPLHRVILNGIADPDRCAAALERACDLVQRSNARVVNHPRSVLAGTRIANAARFARIDNVRVPWTRPLDAGPRPAFPFLVRVLGHHQGKYFEAVAGEAELDAALRGFPAGDVVATELLDTRGSGGAYRKYRVMVVGGELYPLHLAVSEHWKVHYFSSVMERDGRARDEERAFLEDMSAAIGAPAVAALREIGAAMQLDYGGIDFGLGRGGEVLFFEANAAMTAIAPNLDERWAYRRPAWQRVRDALAAMMRDRIAS